MAMIFVHEVSRACLDRLPNEILKTQAFNNLIEIASEVFKLEPKYLVKINMDSPMYSYMKKDNTKSYTRIHETWTPSNITGEFQK